MRAFKVLGKILIALGIIALICGGVWRTTLKELDYAILYSLGMEMSHAGVDTFALEAVPGLIKKWCGEDVYNRVLGGE